MRIARGVVAFSLFALVAIADADDMDAKRRAEIAGPLHAGVVLGKDNAALAEGLMPPEILDYYKKGEFTNTIADYPLGIYQWDDDFLAANKSNMERLDLDETGGIIDKQTGKYPEYIYGYPFPKIDPKDPKAATKLVWNQMYLIFAHLTNAKYYVDLVWLSRSGVDRVSRLQVYFKYFDGQRKKFLPPENSQGLLQQYIAAAESPQDLHGTTALQWRFKDHRRDLTWTYVPALRRIREVSPANRSDGFLGSDISQDDGPFFDGKPNDFDWKLVGEGEMLRFVDPFSLKGEVGREAQPDGSYREKIRSDVPVYGAQDPNWKGNPWAPVTSVLARRPVWIVEGVPKDRYYLYGKIQLAIDKESFAGVYNRKYSWQGELLHDYVPSGYKTIGSKLPDGTMEYFWSGAIQYFSGINLKMDRATNVSFPPGTYADRHVTYPPNFFDYQTLYRFGK
jgi:hypothetical protein